jgi:tetratricopeptide (TPR) repeat protein
MIRTRPSNALRHAPRVGALTALGLALALLATPAAADGPKGAEADTHFRHGVELYRDGDFTTALVEFQRAYELDAKYQVLYNIAEAYFQLQDYAHALQTFQRYLTDGGKRISAKRRKEVDKELEKLKGRVARLSVVTSEPGATVTIDDATVATTPLNEALLVSAGRRKVTATLPGRPPVTRVVELAGGDIQTITLEIPAAAPVKVVAAPQRSIAGPVIAWVSTGALTAGAVATGILALGASGDLKEKLAVFPGDPKAIAAARSKTSAFALATDILAATAIAAGGVSIFLTVRQRADDAPAPAAPTARIVLYPTGVGIAGTF